MTTINSMLPRKAWQQFLLLALAIFTLPSLFGHPFISGDNLIQFNPLRVFAGRIERQGHLPLWNQYLWSGTPLMAGFNAGVYFPTSWLYIFLPSALAWGLNQALPYFLASYGFYLFMRESALSEFTSKLSAVLFAYSGVMIAQGVHLDMIIGISLAPWLLLAASRLITALPRERLRYCLAVAVLYSLIVLAGAPEAMLDELIMLGVFVAIKIWQLRPRPISALAWLGVAGAIALMISAAQWWPGLAYQGISQRSHPSAEFVSFGAFAPQYFFTFVAPYLFGGPGALNIPGYFGPFNWEEVVIYPTIGPVIAFLSTTASAIRRKLDAELVPFIAIAVVGVVLALGSHTPLQAILHHLPLYGEQRLSGRNILAFDLGVYGLFAIWLDRAMTSPEHGGAASKLVAFLPSLLICVLFMTFLFGGEPVASLFHAKPLPPTVSSSVEWEVFIIQLTPALIAGYAFSRAARPTAASYRRWIVAAIVVDLIGFNVFGSLGTASYQSQFHSNSPQMSYVHSLLGSNGRFAVYDPNLFTYFSLNKFGEPDLNIGAGNHSIQGYSSLSLENYQKLTGSHAQATLNPTLFASSLIDTLDTKIVLSSRRYFISRYETPTLAPLPWFYFSNRSPSDPPAAAEYPDLQSSTTVRQPARTFGLFGTTLSINSVDLNIGRTFSPKSIAQVGLLGTDGKTHWLTRSPVTGVNPAGAMHFVLPSQSGKRPLGAIGVEVLQYLPISISDPQKALVVGVGVSSSSGYFALDGVLAPYLTYPHYTWVAQKGDISIFRNSQAKPQLRAANANIAGVTRSLDGSIHFDISAPAATYVDWAEAYAPGWKATLVSTDGKSHFSEPVQDHGSLQRIHIPRGSWRIDVFYHPTSAYVGLAVSAIGVTIVLVALGFEIEKNKRSARRSINGSARLLEKFGPSR